MLFQFHYSKLMISLTLFIEQSRAGQLVIDKVSKPSYSRHHCFFKRRRRRDHITIITARNVTGTSRVVSGGSVCDVTSVSVPPGHLSVTPGHDRPLPRLLLLPLLPLLMTLRLLSPISLTSSLHPVTEINSYFVMSTCATLIGFQVKPVI